MRTTRRIVLGLLLALGLAGCGTTGSGDGVATAGGATVTSGAAAARGGGQDRALQFARCMREQGIEVADPQAGNAPPVMAGTSSKEEMDAAMAKCKQYMPRGGDLQKDDPQTVERKRELARCMRENGVPDYPDPGEDGSVVLDEKSGIDPQDAGFKAAEKACEKFAVQPSGAAGVPVAPGPAAGGN